MSKLSQVKTGEECSKEIVNVYACTSSYQSVVVESTDSRGENVIPILTSCPASQFLCSPNLTPVEGPITVSSESTVEICGETTLTDKVLSGFTNQSSVSPVKSFEQVKQADGHREYGRLHPVRRPWQLMYNTLRWLKPFK